MILTVHVKPNARENTISTVLDETTVKASVKAPAKEGKANKAVIELFSDFFNVSKSEIEIIRGAQTRMKHIEIHGISDSDITLKLAQI